MADATAFFQLLAAIGGEPGLFPAAGDAARKAVNEIVRVQLAAEGSDLAALRKIRAVLGPIPFAEALDGVPAAKAKALLGRLDPHGAGVSTVPERVKRLLALAEGSAEPAEAQAAKEAAPAKKSAARKGAKKAAEPKVPAEPGAEPVPKPRRRITGRAALRVSEER